MPYVRNSIAYDHDFWYTFFGTPLVFFLFFVFCFLFWCWEGGNRAKTGFWDTCVKWWYLQEFFFHFFIILIFWVFQSSSINGKRKFWGVPHLLHICVIFTDYFDKIEWIKCLKWWLQSYKAQYFNEVKFKNSSIMIFLIVIINIIFIVIINTIIYDAFNIKVIKKNILSLKETQISRHIKLNHTIIALLLLEATQKYQKLTDYRTKCCYLSLVFSLLTATCASFAFLNGTVFSVLGHSFECHRWLFVLYIVSFFCFENGFL